MAKKKAKPAKVKIGDKEYTVETVDEETKTKPKPKYVYPYWSNKETKHLIVTLEYPNGTKATASVQDMDGNNADYKAILEEFGEEQIDANTAEGVQRRDDQIKKRLQRKESEKIRAKQEMLFGAKLEAFEITAVKESNNTNLKRLIRKAKTPMEVNAYTTILLMESMDEGN
jgi:hypothetical protein|tara:strand:- start:1275 stop:1787 length:513 start_codon:yes stop_codon:yes gene_type:complete